MSVLSKLKLSIFQFLIFFLILNLRWINKFIIIDQIQDAKSNASLPEFLTENDRITNIPISIDIAYKHLISSMDSNISIHNIIYELSIIRINSETKMQNQMPIFLAKFKCNIANKKLHQTSNICHSQNS